MRLHRIGIKTDFAATAQRHAKGAATTGKGAYFSAL
jgi:hypothetical protein